jgi:hypothetical protein
MLSVKDQKYLPANVRSPATSMATKAQGLCAASILCDCVVSISFVPATPARMSSIRGDGSDASSDLDDLDSRG